MPESLLLTALESYLESLLFNKLHPYSCRSFQSFFDFKSNGVAFQDDIMEGNTVTFEVEKGLKGPAAVRVKLVK